MRNVFLLLLTVIFLVLACEKDVNGPEGGNFIYPLSTGNMWEYSREKTAYNFQPEALSDFSSDTLRATSLIEITGKVTLFDSVEAYVFRESFTENNKLHESEVFFNNGEDGFYCYGYTSGNYAAPLKVSAEKRILFNGQFFRDENELLNRVAEKLTGFSLRADSINYETPPLQSLQYPLKIGSQWKYREKGNPWMYDKRVRKGEMIEVPTGEFYCYVVQWLIDMDANGIWDDNIIFYDYIAKEGLIKRTIVLKDLLLMDINGDVIGSYDTKDEYVLTDLSIKEDE